jgi:restriction endonuclease S subunit
MLRGFVPLGYDVNLHRNLARVLIAQDHDPTFVFYFLSSEFAQAAIKLTTFGSTQALLNLSDLRELRCVVPPLGVTKIDSKSVAYENRTNPT